MSDRCVQCVACVLPEFDRFETGLLQQGRDTAGRVILELFAAKAAGLDACIQSEPLPRTHQTHYCKVSLLF